ncbi:fatty acid desaturase family protein [Sphingomonas sp.]|uniref:fatty acid desaturase family protein n=1 Tax=Sphingomonas sp. TaxID=28214 RepID=UPI002DD65F0C|nr:fatty acid desaturase [Sphingomonas sp.]
MFQAPIVAAGAPPVTPAAFRQRMLVETGQRYATFRKTLAPRYHRVLIDIALGYAALAGLLVLVGQASGFWGGLAAACAGAVGIGFLVAYLQLFIHEGAHFNLSADKRTNDRIADWLVCWQVGTSIAAYRATHSEHHRHLGRVGDTEVSYRHALTPRFVAEMLFGVHAVRVFAARKDQPRARAAAKSSTPLLRGLYLHTAIVGTLLVLGWWPAVLAWLGGIAIAFPFFATVRQLLEHRPTPGMVDEGDSVTRLFGDGPFARIFGGAGFNRHLLHHIEPQVSYTRLADLEAFLKTTSMAAVLDARRATYLGTFAELIRETRR